jgi:hypothetical protein
VFEVKKKKNGPKTLTRRVRLCIGSAASYRPSIRRSIKGKRSVRARLLKAAVIRSWNADLGVSLFASEV